MGMASSLTASSGSSLLGGIKKVEDDSSAAAEYGDRFLAGYEKIRLLGTGACAAVWLAAPSGRSGLVAIKQVAKGTTGKKKADTDSARKELCFGQNLFHPGGTPKVSEKEFPGVRHIAKLIDAVETKRDLWLVQEFGGTCLTKACFEIKGEFVRGERLYRVIHQPLMQAMRRNPVYLKRALKQLLQAVDLLSENRWVHSDIKPENILVDEDEKGELTCRFIDFGSCFSFDRPESLALATPEYMPPEALETCAGRFAGGSSIRLSMGRVRNPGVSAPGGRSSHGQDSGRKSVTDLFNNSEPWSFDMWSMGSIFLELVLGAPLWLPYKCVAGDSPPHTACPGLFSVPGRDPEKIVVKQTDAILNRGLRKVLRDPPGVPLDDAGMDLLERMLCWTPADRISPAEALSHPWLHGV
jgi:dual specificity tyrosine-phosphorylation-regulated kinase 2/3/4